MINVTVYRDNRHHYRGFRCEGHAGYADSGEDIVCSAVSVLVINTINAIEQLTEDAFEFGADPETGLIDLSFPEELHHDADLLMNAMVMGLASIEENYSDFIHFEIEEV
jgi:uncharacterized protein YsxB (DUF464 family)